MDILDILPFCTDTIMTANEIEGNGIFAHAGPNNESEYKHNKNS